MGLVPLSLIAKLIAAHPRCVPLSIARVRVVLTALIESCDIARKQTSALAVLSTLSPSPRRIHRISSLRGAPGGDAAASGKATARRTRPLPARPSSGVRSHPSRSVAAARSAARSPLSHIGSRKRWAWCRVGDCGGGELAACC